MDRYEYMMMHLSILPPEIIQKYNLQSMAHNGKVYMEIRKGMYGLPQTGILAQQQLQRFLEPAEYVPCRYTPGLWKHRWRPVTFTLVVDDFGIKYVGDHNAQHLLNALQQNYTKVMVDWSGSSYCGVDIKWDYRNKTVDLSMPHYIYDTLHKFQHSRPTKPTHDPYPAPLHNMGERNTHL